MVGCSILPKTGSSSWLEPNTGLPPKRFVSSRSCSGGRVWAELRNTITCSADETVGGGLPPLSWQAGTPTPLPIPHRVNGNGHEPTRVSTNVRRLRRRWADARGLAGRSPTPESAEIRLRSAPFRENGRYAVKRLNAGRNGHRHLLLVIHRIDAVHDGCFEGGVLLFFGVAGGVVRLVEP